jgi:hypothetical protein
MAEVAEACGVSLNSVSRAAPVFCDGATLPLARSLLVLGALVGEPRAEGLTRLDPVALGRLLGKHRAPEVGTWRRRMEYRAAFGRSKDLVGAMAAAHLAANQDLPGIFCLDGHVRAYHGRSHLPKGG